MPRMKPSRTGVPRAFADHRTVDARAYAARVRDLQQAYGPVPKVALPTLREAALAALELARLGTDLEAARARRRRRDIARLGRRIFMAREQLMRLERRLQELGATKPADPMAAVRDAVAAANQGQGGKP
jgi:hypothetical protein